MKKSRFTLTGVCFALILSLFVFGCDNAPPETERNLQEEIAALTNQSSWADFQRVNDLLRTEQAAADFNLAELQARANELRARVVSKVAAETFTSFYVAGTILERFRDGNRIVFAYPSTLTHITITPPPGWAIYDGAPRIDVEENSDERVLLFNIGNEMAVVGGNHLVTPVRVELVFEHASRITANFDFTVASGFNLPPGFSVEDNIGIEFATAGLFHGQPAILPLSNDSAVFVARFNNVSATLVQLTAGEQKVTTPTVSFTPGSVTFAAMGNPVAVEIGPP